MLLLLLLILLTTTATTISVCWFVKWLILPRMMILLLQLERYQRNISKSSGFNGFPTQASRTGLLPQQLGKVIALVNFAAKCITSSKTAIQRHSESAQHKRSSSGARHRLSLAACAKKARKGAPTRKGQLCRWLHLLQSTICLSVSALC